MSHSKANCTLNRCMIWKKGDHRHIFNNDSIVSKNVLATLDMLINITASIYTDNICHLYYSCGDISFVQNATIICLV